jgi:hypothetical protein
MYTSSGFGAVAGRGRGMVSNIPSRGKTAAEGRFGAVGHGALELAEASR